MWDKNTEDIAYISKMPKIQKILHIFDIFGKDDDIFQSCQGKYCLVERSERTLCECFNVQG